MVMRIKELRQERGLLQRELAVRVGVAIESISNWEHEVYLPTARTLPLLAHALGCRIDDLFAEEYLHNE